jgi:hypothetical protein
MANEDKTDPVGDEFFRPLLRADCCANGLFYCSAAFSLAALLVDQKAAPDPYALVQIAFALSVIALLLTTLAIRLYFFPRAQIRRYQDFLSHAYEKPLSHKQTTGYYNNAAVTVPTRIAAQVLESSFFSRDTLSRMSSRERIKVGVYVLIWVITVLNRSTDLALVGVAAQIIFIEQILSRWLRLEWLRRECEKTYDDLFRLLQSKGKVDIFALELLGRYEIAKATAAISLSSQIFERNRERMNAEWETIRTTLQI